MRSVRSGKVDVLPAQVSIVGSARRAPAYFRKQMYTAYELLRQRFGGVTRTIASILFRFTRMLADCAAYQALLDGRGVEEIRGVSEQELNEFRRVRDRYLLYK